MTKSGITRFSIKKFCCLTKTKNIVGELFCASKIFWFREIFWTGWGEGGEGGSITFSAKTFSLIVAKKLVEEPFSVSLISGVENFYAQKGYVAFFCRKLLSHSAEDFRRGIFLCFKKFLVSNIFRDKSGWRVSRLFSKLLDLAIPNLLVEERFCVSESLGYGIILCLRAEKNDFPKKHFCVPVPKNFVGQHLCAFTKFLFLKKLKDKMGGKDYHDLPWKILCLSVSKYSTGIIFSVSNFLGSENFYAYEGDITIF